MPATANFGLPYPGALDEPCDFAQDWCAFTDASQVVLDGFQTIADRVYPVQPVAKLDLTTTTFVTNNTVVPFDTVTINNAGYIDFDVSNSVITVNRPGQFIAIFNATVQSTLVANARFLADWGASAQSFGLSHELDIGNTLVGFVANARYSFAFTPNDIYVSLSSTAAVPIEVRQASLSVFWHSDRTTP